MVVSQLRSERELHAGVVWLAKRAPGRMDDHQLASSQTISPSWGLSMTRSQFDYI
jgi:hypothetical protein